LELVLDLSPGLRYRLVNTNQAVINPSQPEQNQNHNNRDHNPPFAFHIKSLLI
jgi:hypothetical protein